MYRCSNALTVFQCLRRRRAQPWECLRRRRALPGEELLKQAPCLAAALLLTGTALLVAATTAVPTVVVPIVVTVGAVVRTILGRLLGGLIRRLLGRLVRGFLAAGLLGGLVRGFLGRRLLGRLLARLLRLLFARLLAGLLRLRLRGLLGGRRHVGLLRFGTVRELLHRQVRHGLGHVLGPDIGGIATTRDRGDPTPALGHRDLLAILTHLVHRHRCGDLRDETDEPGRLVVIRAAGLACCRTADLRGGVPGPALHHLLHRVGGVGDHVLLNLPLAVVTAGVEGLLVGVGDAADDEPVVVHTPGSDRGVRLGHVRRVRSEERRVGQGWSGRRRGGGRRGE